MRRISSAIKRHNKAVRVCVLLLPLVLAALLIVFSPLLIAIGENMPACIIHSDTGLYCPGCGMTRACLALLHGNVLQSLHYHPLPMIALVLFLLFYVQCLLFAFDKRVRLLPRSPVFWAVSLSVLVVFLCARTFIVPLWPV